MNKGITDFPTRLASVAAETEMLLKHLLGDAPLDGEILRPARLIAAMRHAALDGASGCDHFCWWRPPLYSAPRAQAH